MKKVITAVLLLLFVASSNVFAKTDAEFSKVTSFEGGTVNSVMNGTYEVENIKIHEKFFVDGEREIGYTYGKFGKNVDDASLAVKFNQIEFTYNATYQFDPMWVQYQILNRFDTTQKIELGQKIHYSILYADENSTIGMVMKPSGTASSGKSVGSFYYTPV